MKQKRQIAVLAVLLVIAAVVWYFEWRTKTPAMQTVALVRTTNHWESIIRNSMDRFERAQKTEYKSNGRNLFSAIVPPTPADLKKVKDAHSNSRK